MSRVIDEYHPFLTKVVTTDSISGGTTTELEVLTVPKGYVAEVFNIKPIPPVDPDTGTVTDWLYLSVAVNDVEYPYIRMSPIQNPPPPWNQANLYKYRNPPEYETTYLFPAALHRLIYSGRGGADLIPMEEATGLKLKELDTLKIKIRAKSGTDISVQTGAVVEYALCKATFLDTAIRMPEGGFVGDNRLRVVLKRPEGDWVTVYEKEYPEITIDNWTTLPGGLNQGFPQIQPFVVGVENTNATTASTWYQFTEDNTTPREGALWKNFEGITEAILIHKLGVVPDTNLSELRFWYSGL